MWSREPPDWTGIYSIEPEQGYIRFKSDHYCTQFPTAIEIAIGRDPVRFAAAKSYLDEQGIPYKESGPESYRIITIRNNEGDDVHSPDTPTRKLYDLICDVMTGVKQQDSVDGRLQPAYVAAKLHEALFGPLLIHPIDRALRMGEVNEHSVRDYFQKIHAQNPERLKLLLDAFIDMHKELGRSGREMTGH